jgi:ubiquinone/menaquinone biosynthesis C-methylase UbiE
MDNIINFYEKYDEESRLTTNNARKVEFNITTAILNQYIEPNHKILELGAGTGVYSFYYAKKGNEVIATDITPKHVRIIKEKLQEGDKDINLLAEVANATDLSQYEFESFDVVTCLGPMYHLVDDDDRKKCMRESLRVLKAGGILVVAYINKHYVIHSVMTTGKKFFTGDFVDKILSTGVIKEEEKECFWTDAFFTSPTEMESFIKEFNIELVDHVATDGISPLLGNFVDEMNDEEYNTWINYSLNSCREKSILGISNHVLLICRKI